MNSSKDNLNHYFIYLGKSSEFGLNNLELKRSLFLEDNKNLKDNFESLVYAFEKFI